MVHYLLIYLRVDIETSFDDSTWIFYFASSQTKAESSTLTFDSRVLIDNLFDRFSVVSFSLIQE